MINKKLSRAVAATAGVGLAFASLVGIAAPAATAADATTHFKIHLNVPAEVASQWNIWYWNTGLAGVDPKDNTLGTSTQTINGAPVVKDWTPNFSNDDAYGSYAEFDLPVAITALNNVMRTTESWDGQDAAAAVVDDPATADVDETAAAKPAIEAADKPFGGDNIFPAGESWWNVNTQKREYPLKDVVSIKVHLNAKLATLQSQGWNLYSWGTTVDAPKLSTIKAYKGKVDANLTGWGFSGSDKYGSFAIVKTARVYAANTGLVLRRSGKIGTGTIPANGWGGPQSGDFKNTDGNTNGFKAGVLEYWMATGSSDLLTSAPTFVGRYGATATWSAGTLTVTPVRPAAASLKGLQADKIVVTVKKGATSKTCTIENAAYALTSPAWNTPASCDIAVAAGAEAATWDVFVQGSATSLGTALIGPNRSAKVLVPIA